MIHLKYTYKQARNPLQNPGCQYSFCDYYGLNTYVPSEFICWKSNFQRDSIRRWGFGTGLGHEGRVLENEIQFSSVAQSCPTLCHPMNCSMPDLPVHHQLPEFTETHVHRVGDAIQPSHPLLFPFPPAPNPSQHQGLFQWVNSLHEVAKVLEFQLQHQFFQGTPRTDLL